MKQIWSNFLQAILLYANLKSRMDCPTTFDSCASGYDRRGDRPRKLMETWKKKSEIEDVHDAPLKTNDEKSFSDGSS